MSAKRLTAEDRALWERVKASATPLRQPVPLAPALGPPPAAAPPAPPKAARPLPPPLPAFQVGSHASHRRDHDLLPGLSESLTGAPLRMDAGRHKRMTRGKLRPEARIDLHGMTAAQAHPALASFVLDARARGRRLVLVITGKGRERDDLAPMPARAGRLRHDVPRWLMLPPLSEAVLQVAPAHRTHGGEGALYVYLRA